MCSLHAPLSFLSYDGPHFVFLYNTLSLMLSSLFYGPVSPPLILPDFTV